MSNKMLIFGMMVFLVGSVSAFSEISVSEEPPCPTTFLDFTCTATGTGHGNYSQALNQSIDACDAKYNSCMNTQAIERNINEIICSRVPGCYLRSSPSANVCSANCSEQNGVWDCTANGYYNITNYECTRAVTTWYVLWGSSPVSHK